MTGKLPIEVGKTFLIAAAPENESGIL